VRACGILSERIAEPCDFGPSVDADGDLGHEPDAVANSRIGHDADPAADVRAGRGRRERCLVDGRER